MAKVIDTEITGIDTAWYDSTTGQGYSGARVEEFIKKQLKLSYAYVSRSAQKETDGWHMRFFRSLADYNTWNAAEDKTVAAISALLLSDIILPDTHEATGQSYIVGLYTGSDTSSIVTIDNKVVLKLRFTSQVHDNVNNTTDNTGEGGILTIQRRTSSTGDWVTVGTLSVQSMDYSSTTYTDIDISSMLSDGYQQVRVVVKGDTTELTTRYITYQSVIKTTLSLEFANQWWTPITDLASGLPISYYIKGAVSKTLTVIISGKTSAGAAGKRTLTYNIGSSIYTETPWSVAVTDSDSDTVKVLTHGIHTIEAYITVSGGTVTSEHVYSQVFVVADKTDMTPYLLLNNVASKATNWTQVKLFDYSLYNPSGSAMNLTFSLGDYAGTTEYMSTDVANVAANTKYIYENTIEIDSTDTTLSAYMRFKSGTTSLADMIGITVDNSQNFSPTANADFILNPGKRSNGETSPQTIINTVTKAVVPSTWSGFGLKKDGWITDENGVHCLRILAGQSIDINYEAFSDFLGTGSHTNSMTMMFDIKTSDVDDETSPILRVCSYQTNGNPLGFEMKPMEACFMTLNKQVQRDQDIMFQEGARTHIAVNIVHNLSNAGINYIRILVNGTINREIEWTDDDTFVQNVNGTQTSQGIRIGAENASIDVYSIYVYKKSLSALDVRQNRLASLPTVAEKIAYRDANDIVGDNGTISFSKTSEKYNTLVWTGSVPSYIAPASIKAGGTLDINIIGDKAHSGTITNLGIKGQGSSSKGYYKWNHQYAFNADSVWTDGNGTAQGAYYILEDGMPKATKLVSKLNWASSMQSHKPGATALFTDLWRKVVGGNSITKTDGYSGVRVSVKEKPFFLFVKATADAEPEFYGFMTFGPGKGDKATFGYDKTVFPDYLMLEGSDNGKPLTEHRVPWMDDEVTYSADDESYKYAGELNWDYDLGNLNMVSYFKNAFNFVFLHAINIKPYVGKLSALQTDTTADKATQYWVTEADATNNSAQYDLYRYDYVTSMWVNASTTKTNNVYDKLNINTQCGGGASGIIWDTTNQQFIDWRVADFKANAGTYYNVSDAQFAMLFCKLFAASDNRAKNIYLYLDPKTHLICFAQDDLDTILATDNVGRKNKPYYVEEHDVDASGQNYWNGTNNQFYNLMEAAYPVELMATMNSMLTGMAELGGSVSKCMEKYFFYIQRYFPSVAYNETARLLYETASKAWSDGTYMASVHPIAQSLGDQLQAELQWWKRREVYMSSFASYGQFSVRGTGCLMFRSILALNSDGTTSSPMYSFTLIPHIWLYPAAGVGQTLAFGLDGNGKSYTVPQRIKAGETFVLGGLKSDGNTDIYIDGVDYYKSIGNFGGQSLGETFTLFGNRLVGFSATVASGSVMQFRPTSLTCTAKQIDTFDIGGASTVGGSLDLSACWKIKTINVKGTAITTCTLPATDSLTSLSLPASLVNLTIDNQPNIATFSMEGYSNLQKVIIDQSKAGKVDTKVISNGLMSANPTNLNVLELDNVNWTNCPANLLMWLCNKGAKLTGKITLTDASSDRFLTFAEKLKLVGMYGNIDSTDNALYISYTTKNIVSISIVCQRYMSVVGDYNFTVRILPLSGNNVAIKDGHADVNWSIADSAAEYASFTDAINGVMKVTKLSDASLNLKHTVTLTVTLMNGTTMTQTVTVGFYKRIPQVGDFAYSDGSFDNEYDTTRTLVGIAFMRENITDTSGALTGYKVRVVSLTDMGIKSTDGTSMNLTQTIFGLYPDNNSNNGFNTTVEGDIKTATNLTSVFDIPTIGNITSGIDGNYVNDSSFVDDTQDDGYKKSVSGYAAWDLDGEDKADKIIAHCDNILTNYLGIDLPDSVADLGDKMVALYKANSNSSRFYQYFYPAAYVCHVYQPDADDLNSQYVKGNWYLPTEGELARIYNFYRLGTTSDKANDNALNEARTPIFANAAKRAGVTVISFTNSWYWSSSEISSNYAWIFYFSNGQVYGNDKSYSYCVRAVTAFTFNL
jgi:hypothetical protein